MTAYCYALHLAAYMWQPVRPCTGELGPTLQATRRFLRWDSHSGFGRTSFLEAAYISQISFILKFCTNCIQLLPATIILNCSLHTPSRQFAALLMQKPRQLPSPWFSLSDLRSMSSSNSRHLVGDLNRILCCNWVPATTCPQEKIWNSFFMFVIRFWVTISVPKMHFVGFLSPCMFCSHH